MTVIREIKQSPMPQGVDEEVKYTLTTTPWGSTPTSPSVAVYDVTDGSFTDVTSTVMPGSPSTDGDVITLPVMKDLVEGKSYRIEVKFTASGNIFEPYAYVYGER